MKSERLNSLMGMIFFGAFFGGFWFGRAIDRSDWIIRCLVALGFCLVAIVNTVKLRRGAVKPEEV